MLKDLDFYRRRLGALNDGLKARLWGESVPLSLSVFAAPGRIPFAEAVKGAYRPAQVGEVFGPLWATFWFRVEAVIPPAWAGREVHLYFSNSAEGLIWSEKGEVVQGLTGANWLPNDAMSNLRSNLRLTESAQGGERVVFYIESACNPLCGAGMHPWNVITEFQLNVADLRCLNRPVEALFRRYDTLCQLANQLPEDNPLRRQAIFTADAVGKLCDPDDLSTFPAALDALDAFFADHRTGSSFTVSAVGHAHIDTAWLWPVAETKRKCARSFSSAVRMMDRYPSYQFACSQAQQLAWVKELYPDLYSAILTRAKRGQFRPVGGTWIEPDCNIPSGESLVRQFLLGQRFFQREFGERSRVFWNPDVFGYTPALPQIMKQAGIDFFLTQKLSWNDTNKPTASTFLWEGLDGTRVLTHFPPADNYNCTVDVGEVFKSFAKNKDVERSADAYLLFGYGDGGGGPTEAMLERIALLDGLESLPRLESRGPLEFFERLAASTRAPVVWSGELYLEAHRATYTSQAACKRDNRRCEEALHDAELLAAVAHARGLAAYPRAEFTRLWELTCLNQFHDILPGSSIAEVYADTAREHADVLASAAQIRDTALSALGLAPTASSTAAANHVVAVNTLGFPRREVVTLADGPAFVEAPSMGYAIAPAVRTTESPVTVSLNGDATAAVLENALIRVELDAAGRLVSFFDKRSGREAVALGALGNQFVLFTDTPQNWEAWDVDLNHLDHRRLAGTAAAPLRIASAHALEGVVEVRLALSEKSTLRQLISLHAESPRLDFATEVEWHEDQQFLKVEFALDVRCDHATYEMQHGHVRRPTHFNTSWDYARFEVCAHRWADLSDTAWGVALLNDSKYGHACHGNTLRLSLLRAPRWPDPRCDRGYHAFRYALYLHAGSPQTGGVVAAAAAFNQPLRVAPTAAAARTESFLSIDNPGLVIDTVKLAEDSDAMIVRLYESSGALQRATLRTTLPITRAERVNLLEDVLAPQPVTDGGIALTLRPFEIITLKLT
jgi:alpha-mannosidase